MEAFNAAESFQNGFSRDAYTVNIRNRETIVRVSEGYHTITSHANFTIRLFFNFDQ